MKRHTPHSIRRALDKTTGQPPCLDWLHGLDDATQDFVLACVAYLCNDIETMGAVTGLEIFHAIINHRKETRR